MDNSQEILNYFLNSVLKAENYDAYLKIIE